MKVEAAIFGQICDQCKQPILNKKGIALIDGEQSKTYCQDCYVSIKSNEKENNIENIDIETLPKPFSLYWNDEVLATLTPREEKIIRMYYKQDTFIVDIAKHFKIDVERVQQIMDKALRKLKHPKRLKMMNF